MDADAADPARSASAAATAAVALLYFSMMSVSLHPRAVVDSWLETPEEDDDPPDDPPDADHFRSAATEDSSSTGTTSTEAGAAATVRIVGGEADACLNSKVGEGAVQCSRLDPDPPAQHMIPVTRPAK